MVLGNEDDESEIYAESQSKSNLAANFRYV